MLTLAYTHTDLEIVNLVTTQTPTTTEVLLYGISIFNYVFDEIIVLHRLDNPIQIENAVYYHIKSDNDPIQILKVGNHLKLIIVDQLDDGMTLEYIRRQLFDSLSEPNTIILNIQNVSDWEHQSHIHWWYSEPHSIICTLCERRYVTLIQPGFQERVLKRICQLFYKHYGHKKFIEKYMEYTKDGNWCTVDKKSVMANFILNAED